MLSPRTTKYVEARIQEGDDFDYRSWVRHVRQEETKAKEAPAELSFGKSVTPALGDLSKMPDRLDARANAASAVPAKSIPIPTPVYGSDHKVRRESPQNRLRRRLAMVSDAFDEFQESRVRDAIYGYLKAVFALVVDCKGRRKTKRLLQRTFQFAGLPFDKSADPFAAVIRCTSERRLDCKSISKYSRALRYAARCKKPRTSLKTFMKEMGGVGGCADRFARYLGRGSQ